MGQSEGRCDAHDGLPDKLVLFAGELQYGFLEVANAAMNELGRLRVGGCPWVRISPGGSIAKKQAELSTSATLSPRLAASTATPAPVAPPLTIKMSNSVSTSPRHEALRTLRFCSRVGGR